MTKYEQIIADLPDDDPLMLQVVQVVAKMLADGDVAIDDKGVIRLTAKGKQRRSKKLN